jgi:alkylation response protein AidB-like acyl-CoA dehydrogenase
MNTDVSAADREDLRASVRAFLADRSPVSEVRRVMDTPEGYDAEVWHALSQQLGLTALIVPEEYGGWGYSYRELAVVLEEMGRTLFCSPYFATVALATGVLLATDAEDVRADYLPGIAKGALTATLAPLEDDGRWETSAVTTTARLTADGWILNGHKAFVVDGHSADLVLLPARTDAGLSMFAVSSDSDGLTATRLPTMDPTRRQARLVLSDTPARLVGGESLLSRGLDLARVALAAEQVGGSQRALDMCVEYAATRHQFGRPIGSFQAIKHTCADLLVEVELARSAAYHAAAAASSHPAELPAAASLAAAYCADAYVHVAEENLHIHGGIGFTWEHDAQLYFKRAHSCHLAVGGGSDYHREQLLQRLGVG